ncbi:MAG: hypothetical protein ABJF89_10690 [Parasphingorhabdus sp.]|uniref:hypothetical protein n=1 Tax=Parasphingorhabdus sp. TaxID=2709688 RepID=UPI003266E83A
MTFVYGAYGLNIRSDISIDFLTPLQADAAIDVTVCFQPDDSVQSNLNALPWEPPRAGPPHDGIGIGKYGGQLKLLYPRDPHSALEFVISEDAKRVTILRPGEIPEIDAISFFIGPVCGVLSRLRSRSCLHASVLTLNGRAFALTGDKGAGKSTTSAMLTTCGAMLVADDIGVLSHNNNQFWVQPAYPFMRLSPPEIELTGRSMADTRELLSVGDKRYVSVEPDGEGGFPLDPLPLDAIYFLSRRGNPDMDISIDRLEPNEAARLLNSNGYGHYIMDTAMRRQDFSLFAKFAREKHSRAISRPDDLSRLAELAQMILDNFRETHD